MIVRNYYKQLYAKIFDNLGKMDKFLETCNLSKLVYGSFKKLHKIYILL